MTSLRLIAWMLLCTATTPEAHAAFVNSEIVRWGKVIKEAGVRVE